MLKNYPDPISVTKRGGELIIENGKNFIPLANPGRFKITGHIIGVIYDADNIDANNIIYFILYLLKLKVFDSALTKAVVSYVGEAPLIYRSKDWS